MTMNTSSDSTVHGRKRLRNASLKHEEKIKESLPNLSEEEIVQDSGKEVFVDVQHRHGHVEFVKAHKRLFSRLFGTSLEAKIWGIASKGLSLSSPPIFYPEYTEPGGVDYVYRDLDFWTSGFFPGSLHLLLERRRKAAGSWKMPMRSMEYVHDIQLEYACKYWTENLHQNARLRTTHDVGFMIMPWARLAYELNNDLRALETIKTAALSLYSRFDVKLGCIRSWDKCVTRKYHFDNPDSEFMVIIDNMMNLDLLFYAASKTRNTDMYNAAVEHARTTARMHIRHDGSTTHLIVLDSRTGNIRHRFTNQGYAHTSCWTRGQAWAIAGFAETYLWTHEREFLDTARRCADCFLTRLGEATIVPWDFDAPHSDGAPQPSDSSAAVIAAYGMLLVHKGLIRLGQSSQYLKAAMKIMHMVCSMHVNEQAVFTTETQTMKTVEHGATTQFIREVNMNTSETILGGATINNYEFAPRRWANHGLVYADYYFLLIGNLLLDMGLILPDVYNYEENVLTR